MCLTGGNVFDRISPWQPWLQGREPEPSSSRQHKPFQEGQEPNCPEFPRAKWKEGKDGKWFNSEVCTSNDDDDEQLVVDDADDIADELGTVESSEEEDDAQNAKQ